MIKNRSMPSSIIIPEIPYPDVIAAAEWLCRAFGFKKRLQIGGHRFQLTFGGGDVVVVGPASNPAPQSIMVRVPDVVAHYVLSQAQGARVLNQPQDYPYGERQYSAEDLAGHRWTFSQSTGDIDPADWGGIGFE